MPPKKAKNQKTPKTASRRNVSDASVMQSQGRDKGRRNESADECQGRQRASSSNRQKRDRQLDKDSGGSEVVKCVEGDEILRGEPSHKKRKSIRISSSSMEEGGKSDIRFCENRQLKKSDLHNVSSFSRFQEEILQRSAEAEDLVEKCQNQSERHDQELLASARKDNPGAFSAQAADNKPSTTFRPSLHAAGLQALGRARDLLEAYDEFNAKLSSSNTGSNSAAQWQRDADFTSEVLLAGASYGHDLVAAMLRPGAFKIPTLDTNRSQEPAGMAVKMYESEELETENTWGQNARILLDGWKELLLALGRC